MKERPIIFSTESVQAILDGRKTQTRRAVKPTIDGWEPYRSPGWYTQTAIDRDGMIVPGKEVFGISSEDGEHGRACPFGAPGDRLWVREAFFINHFKGFNVPVEDRTEAITYRADPLPCWEGEEHGIPWKSPLFMPRWASRLTLEITDVRCERLQDITENDAKAEGIILDPTCVLNSHIGHYSLLWDKLNAKRGFGWCTNPWVWVIEFKRVEKEDKE